MSYESCRHRIAVVGQVMFSVRTALYRNAVPVDTVCPLNDEALAIGGGTSVREPRWDAADGCRMLTPCLGTVCSGWWSLALH